MKRLIAISLISVCLLSTCSSGEHKIQLLNEQAALPSFKFDSLGLKVMTSFINKKSGTMYVLYANPLALAHAIEGGKDQAIGEERALITWKQQPDEHWFGARIPGALQSVEVIKTVSGASGTTVVYEKYTGKDLLASTDTLGRHERIQFILNQQASVMP